MEGFNLHIDRQLTDKEFVGVAQFSSSMLKKGCAYDDKKEVKLFAYHKVHAPFQRNPLASFVNRAMRRMWKKYHKARKNGADGKTLASMCPKGQIVLGTINALSYDATPKMVIVDGQQRLAQLVAASKEVGEEIIVELPVIIIERSSVKELASHFLKWNSCNSMSKRDFISAAVAEGKLSEFVDKIANARKAGLLQGCEIGLRPNKERRLKLNEFDIQEVLTWLSFGVCGNTNKDFMIENGNKFSQEAIDDMCIMLSMFNRHIKFKNFCVQKHFAFRPYSSDTFMCALSRLVMVEGIDRGGWLTTEALNFWLTELQNVTIQDGRKSLGMKWLDYVRSATTGGCKGRDMMYATFTRSISDEHKKSGVKRFGVAVNRPNGNYAVKYAKTGFGYSPEDNRTSRVDEGVELD